MGIKNFFKNAFGDMKESAKAQHEVDKANWDAARAESKAQWEEAKAIGDPNRRKAVFQAERNALIRDADAKAAIAKKFIDDKDLIKKISYEDLKEYLSNESSIDVTLARRMYLLERSIPRRQGDTHTWLERLKIFTDTSTLEHSIVASKNVLGKKLYFTRKSGDHESLHYGAGSYA